MRELCLADLLAIYEQPAGAAATIVCRFVHIFKTLR